MYIKQILVFSLFIFLTKNIFAASQVNELFHIVTAAESNDVQNLNWAPEKIFDGKVGTSYSSKGFSTAKNDRGTYLLFRLGQVRAVSFLKLRARLNQGRPEGFPRHYRVLLSANGGTSWNNIGEFSAQPDSTGYLDLNLGRNYALNTVKIEPLILGQAGGGGFYFQLSEVSLGNKSLSVQSSCTAAEQNARPFAGGSGTLENPYLLCHIQQIDQIRFYSTAHFKMKSDIHARATNPSVVPPPKDQNVSWKDGMGFLPIPRFRGSFDGGGFGIYGLYTDRSNLNYIGLFEELNNATVKNLKLEEIVLRASPQINGFFNVGAVAGNVVSSKISNIKIRGVINVNAGQKIAGAQVGGVFGTASKSSFEQLSSDLQVMVSRSTLASAEQGNLPSVSIGGLIGDASQSFISDAEFTGHVSTVTHLRSKVTGIGSVNIGGILGDLRNGALKNALTSGSLGASLLNYGSSVGGLRLEAGGLVASGIVTTFMPDLTYPIDPHLIQNSVSTSSIMSYVHPGTSVGSAVEYIGALAGSTIAPADWTTKNITNSFWSMTASRITRMCGQTAGLSGCDNAYGVNAGESYFYSPHVSPLNLWDFNALWLSQPAALPSLR